MLDIVTISGEDVCCSVMFGTLVGVFVFSSMWSELLTTSAISCSLWSSVYKCQRVECAFTSPVRTDCGMFVMSCICSFVVSMRYINVCNSDVFSVVNMYLDYLKLCIVCINGRRYVCCSECNVVFNECDEPTPASMRTVVMLCTLGVSLIS